LLTYGILLCTFAAFVSSTARSTHGSYFWTPNVDAQDVSFGLSANVAALLTAEGVAWILFSFRPWPENRVDPWKAALCAATGACLTLGHGISVGEHDGVRLFQDAALAIAAQVILFAFEKSLFHAPRPSRTLFAAFVCVHAASVLPGVAHAFTAEDYNRLPVLASLFLSATVDASAWLFAVSPGFSYARLWAVTSVCLLGMKLLFLLL
jgi:hypothetical protein